MAPHGLILTITIALGAAFVGGFLATKLRLPPIVGYLAAGIAVGPFTPGLAADPQIARELAEVGVILLMFGVGVHFSLNDLWSVRTVAIPGAIGQIVIATAITALVVPLWGWTYAQGIVFGLAIAISSTVVLIRALSEVGLLDSAHGKIAVGWVVVEDLAIVVVLVLLPPLAPVLGGSGGGGTANLLLELTITLAKVGLFGLLMVVVGTRVIPWLLAQVALTGHRELFTLAVLVVAIGVAVLAGFAFQVSLALGAFLAGVAISESDLSHQAAAEALPLRDAFAVLFFVSVGMLFDPTFVIREPLLVAAVVALVVVRKWFISSAIVLALGYPIRTALIVGGGLAQIGEFSFVLSQLDRDLGVLPPAAHDLIIAGALITITLNPLLLRSVDPMAQRVRELGLLRRYEDRRAGALARLEREPEEKLQRHAVVTGHGQVGSLVTRALQRRNMDVLVIEQDRRVVEDLRASGTPAIFGDAGHELVLERAHLERAILLVVALPDPQTSRRVIDFARRANERIGVVARAHSKDAAEYLRKAGANEVVLGEEELAIEMTGYALHRLGVSPQEVALIARGLRARS
ncbi:MAG TPA: cation:proton antiporter [Candidatus Limnocylindria bacterium]|jgi:CPA2 family monovalent cation:H+ antiporter-2|nr:cation:proton antiporter [Candidatus Limnocylindria bacterium]